MTIDPRMIKARSSLVTSQPFFGTLALYLQLVEDPSVETMSTDGDKLFYDPAFLDRITPKELKGVIAHEVMHCAYQHHLRRGTRDAELWNDAADYAINPDLIASGFELPEGVFLDVQYKGMSVEEIYARLKAERSNGQPKPQGSAGSGGSAGGGNSPSPAQPAPGGPKNGPSTGPGASPGSPSPAQGTNPPPSGATGPTGPGSSARWGQVKDAAPAHEAAAQGEAKAEWERRVRQAVAVAARANAGTVPGNLQGVVQALNKPTVDWRSELQAFIRDKTVMDYSWTNPNKRFLNSGFILPGVKANGIKKLGIVVDTSGSVDERLLSKFFVEIEDAMEAAAVQEVIVVQCDARVQLVTSYTAGDVINPKVVGRGGTRFAPAIEWYKENEPDVAALIYFTDLECDDYGEEPYCPLLWAAYGMESRLQNLISKVPFGSVIQIPN